MVYNERVILSFKGNPMDAMQQVYTKVKMLPMSQIQQVLDFIDNLPTALKAKNSPTKACIESEDINPEVAKYAGMVKVKSTPDIENLLNFDSASIATDTL